MIWPTFISIFGVSYFALAFGDPLARSQGRADRALYRDLGRRFDCEADGFHADPNDCTTFYRCIDWGTSAENSVQSRFTSFQFQCGPGTVFEPESSICVHPSTSSREECRQYELPVDPEPEPPSPDYNNWENQPEQPQPAEPSPPFEPQPQQPSYGGSSNTDYLGSGRPPKPVYVQPESQGGYGEPSPQPLRPSRPESEPDNNVDNWDNPAPEPPAPSTNSPKCTAEGFFAIEGDCAHFYRCVNNGESEAFVKYEFSCGAGTVFDPDSNICNYPSSVSRTDCRTPQPGNSGSESQNPDEPSGSYGQGSAGNGYGSPSGSNVPASGNQNPPPSENNEEQPIEFPGQTKPPSTVATKPTATYPTRPPSSQGGSQPGYGPQTKPSSTTTTTRPTTSSSTTSRPTYPTRPSNAIGGGQSGYGPPPSTQKPSGSGQTPSSGKPSNQTTPAASPGNCTSEGFFPIEGDCKKFIRCVEKGNGTFIKYDFECGEGTVWDAEQNTCNFPGNVQRPDCGYTTPSRPPTESTTASSGAPSTPSGPTSTYPGQNTKPSSEGGSYYPSPGTQTTIKPTTSTPAYKPKPSSTSKQTTAAKPTTTYQPTSTSQQASTSKPTTSYQSTTSKPTTSYQTTTSKPTTAYTTTTTSKYTPYTKPPTTSKPTYPTSSSKPTPSTPAYLTPTSATSGPPSPASQTNSSCVSEGFFPVAEDCNKFIRCVSNGEGYTKYEFSCGPGTVWDPENNVCNHPSAVANCGQPSSGAGSETGESTKQPDSESSSSYPSQGSTTSQKPYSTTTPTKTSTSKPYTTTTKSTTYQPTTKPSSTTTKSTTYKPTTKPAYTTSSSTTKPTTTTYKTTTKYPTDTKPTTQTTSKPYTTKSPTTAKPESNGTTPVPCDKTTKAPSKIKCEKAGFFPHPDDCKKFYRCVDWDGDKGERFSVYFFDCPEGTIFDPALDTCNYEASVYPPRDCSGSSNATSEEPPKETQKPESQYSTTPTSTAGTTNAPVDYTTESSTTAATTPATTPDYATESSSTAYTTEGTTESSTYSSTEGTTESSTYSSTYSSESTEGTTESTTTGYYSSTEGEYTSESSTYSSTESSSESTTNHYSTTSDYSSTQEYSTQSSTEPTTDYTTTEKTTDYPTSTETVTYPPGQVNQTCPDLEEDQFAVACPTGFRRHPKHCNLFYQCTISENNEIKVLVLSCPNSTVFDDSKLQCLPSEQTYPCSGNAAEARSYRRLADGSLPPIQVLSKKELCPAEGSFPYESDCQKFYKCKQDNTGKMSGYLYQCPDGYSYWDVSRRCERNAKTPSCKRGNGTMKKIWRPSWAPMETRNLGNRR